jgi:hypothetical protein
MLPGMLKVIDHTLSGTENHRRERISGQHRRRGTGKAAAGFITVGGAPPASPGDAGDSKGIIAATR